ncbi:hypothetical protein A9Q84_21620 [Halobacteriovorax marinus]|uniref:Prepilin type IV endopeptidase peptidase domain-containing protein n=1 Tax=Halobacteriovorax marinus TaxID=97084 RepID=A0A1Y5F1T8_9BACT|nr:hypothetical protein A9Q84_21620 [Halobacteriovorax marinus]
MPVSVYLFLVVQLVFVAYNDITNKKISNLWPLINIGFFILSTFLFSDYYSFQLNTFVFPITFFLVGLLLFILKIMGAGDSKYLLSFYLLIPVSLHETAFVFLAYSTVIVGLSLLLTNIMKRFDIIKIAILTRNIRLIKTIFGQRFSYAPVILVSWLWFGWEIRTKILY